MQHKLFEVNALRFSLKILEIRSRHGAPGCILVHRQFLIGHKNVPRLRDSGRVVRKHWLRWMLVSTAYLVGSVWSIRLVIYLSK